MYERLAGLSMPSAVWRSTSFVSKASVTFPMAIVQPLHAQTWAWPGWAFIRELISPALSPISAMKTIKVSYNNLMEN